MFCPECKGEFRSEIEVCPGCGVNLVLDLSAAQSVELVSALETSDASLIPVVKSVLTAAGIPFVVQGEQAVGIDPVGSIAGAAGLRGLCAIVLVPADRKEEAQIVLETEVEDGAL